MARKSIAELRRMEVKKLARLKSANPTENDLAEARRIMNSFYRLCGLSERTCELSNDTRMCNGKYLKRLEEKEQRWIDRLDRELHDTYGLNLCYAGIYPSIVTVGKNGRVNDAVYTYFYN